MEGETPFLDAVMQYLVPVALGLLAVLVAGMLVLVLFGLVARRRTRSE